MSLKFVYHMGMSNVFFTSDTHFSHENIIKYSKRPFANAKEMDETMIANWNAVVKPGDRVYHLGDFSWSDPGPILKRLNGQKYLILGNHDDEKQHQDTSSWVWIKNAYDLKFEKQTVVLYHYGQRVWNKMHHGSWQLFGHSHGTLPPHGKSFDVGVDCWGYTPISFQQVKAQMETMELITGIGED